MQDKVLIIRELCRERAPKNLCIKPYVGLDSTRFGKEQLLGKNNYQGTINLTTTRPQQGGEPFDIQPASMERPHGTYRVFDKDPRKSKPKE